jgi:hypothetical protein
MTPVYALDRQPPPDRTDTVRAVLRLLCGQPAESWVPCPHLLRAVPALRQRRTHYLRRLAACGWAERRYRIGGCSRTA